MASSRVVEVHNRAHFRAGSKTVLTPLKWDVCFIPESRHSVSYAADCHGIHCYGSAQGIGDAIRCDHLVHERSSSNDDVACSLTVVSDIIERLPDYFQIWRLSTQQL